MQTPVKPNAKKGIIYEMITVALAIIKSANKYLLVSSPLDYGKYSGKFYPPGGKVLDGETDQSTVIKKLFAELNLNIVPQRLLAITPADIEDQEIHWWECACNNIDELEINHKNALDHKWLTREQVINSDLCWPATKKFFSTIS